MNIRRFSARDSRSALALVREELGAEAVILSNRRVADGVEVVAACNLEAVEQAAAGSEQPAAVVAPPVENELGMVQLQNELANLRSLLETELQQRNWRDSAAKAPVRATLNQRLARMGFSRALSEGITDALPTSGGLEALWQRTLAALEARLLTLPDGLPGGTRVVACVGTTGVGKTSTIAKLAGRAVLSHGREQVGLITMDQYRIGGQEQLATFATLLDVPLQSVSDGPELYAALRDFRNRRHIFVDTAGMGQRDPRLLQQIEVLRESPIPVTVLGVLSASVGVAPTRELVHSLGRQGLSGAIITKLDEAAGVGGTLDTLIRAQLPVAYTSSGQRVPDDLQPARAGELIALAADWLRQRRRADAVPPLRAGMTAMAS